jgi:hypothetical protein
MITEQSTKQAAKAENFRKKNKIKNNNNNK